ncbi:MAG TPA: IPT/TIG domain-containing protein [Actinomycetota bacterium]|nr:IPT/TIG domain-containing protein [Actinomycetota bacterium]
MPLILTRRAGAALLGLLVIVGILAAAPSARAQSGRVIRFSLEPRVIDADSTQPIALVAVTDGADSAEIRLLDGTSIPMSSIGASTFGASLSAAQALRGYKTGELHNLIGSILTYDSGIRTDSVGLEINVRDSTMPDVPISARSSDVQTSPHVINLRYDTLYSGDPNPENVMKTFYSRFADDFDFAFIVSQERFAGVGFSSRYEPVSNDVRGIGDGIFNRGPQYGSAGELEGIVLVPNDNTFDLAGYLALHEVGHRWMNHLNLPRLAPAAVHWPRSDLLHGIIGGGTGTQLGYFDFDFVPLGGGSYQLERGGARGYNDLELYLMGMLAPEDVGTHFVFDNQSQPPEGDGVIWSGPVTHFAINDVIGTDGTREPGVSSSQKNFRVAAIVLSHGELLSPTEMAFFDHMAARAEARERFTVRTPTDPFHVATRGVGTLTSALAEPGAPEIRSFEPDSGQPGAGVVLRGSNLIRATEVRFAGTRANFTVDSNGQLTAVVPSGASSGRISVTTPSGTSTSSASFNVGGSVKTHARQISLRLVRGSGRLEARGTVSVDDGFANCYGSVTVKIARRSNGIWTRIATVATTSTGSYSATIANRRGTYRATAPRFSLFSGHVCTRATTRARLR